MRLVNLSDKVLLFCSLITSRIINGYRNPKGQNFKAILCIKFDEIGDMCYATHVFKMLKKQYPDSNITLLCKPYATALLKNDSSINRIITDEKQLEKHYDLIIDLRGNYRTICQAFKVMPKLRLDRGTVRFQNSFKKQHPHEVITNFQIVEPIIDKVNVDLQPELFLSSDDLTKASEFLMQNKIERFAVFHISSRKELKKWPAEKFSQLANYIYYERKLQIVFIGDISDERDVTTMQVQLPFPTYSVAGILSLTELAALLKKAIIYIGNDSGPLHIATLIGTPCIGLYGPGPAHVFYPYGEKSKVVHHILPCNPCDQIHCVHPDNPCMNRITLEEVKEKVIELLGDSKPAAQV